MLKLPADGQDLLTGYLRHPLGKQRLRPIQTTALAELYEQAQAGSAIVGAIGVGHGKFLITALAPTLLADLGLAKRVLLLVPAKLVWQTEVELERAKKHWRVRDDIRVLSYEKLSIVSYASFLDEFVPDLVMADEAHSVARPSSARTRRLMRYLRAHPECLFLPLSGTITRKSVKDFAHIVTAALREGAPVPRTFVETEQWSAALDDGVRDEFRLGAGALAEFCTDEELLEGLNGVRKGVRRRYVETPGFVATSEAALGASLILRARHVDLPPVVRDALGRLRSEYVLPNGDEVDSGIAAWSAARQLATGFAYKWDPQAPDAWLNARKGWFRRVRELLQRPPQGMRLDSPLEVARAALSGQLVIPEYNSWAAIRPTFTPNPVPMWLSDFLIRDAEKWALENDGIVWVEHSAAYRGVTGAGGDDDLGNGFRQIPYFGAGKAGEAIANYKGPCAASIRAHGTGKNLTQWTKGLILNLPSSGASIEQLLARLHRPRPDGTEPDEVEFEFYCHTREMYESFTTGRRGAEYIQSLTSMAQKLCYGTLLDTDGSAFSDEKYQRLIDSGAVEWQRNGGVDGRREPS